MKKIIITVSLILAAGIAAMAQPKAVGLRLGATGLEASYEHNISRDQFIEANLGLDFGYNVVGNPGLKVSGVYNFVWARPAWTTQGSWALYAGPGITLGFVDDLVPYEIGEGIRGYHDNGFAIGVTGQVGLEYSFWLPLQLSVDLRPCIGLHINDGRFRDPYTNTIVKYGSKVGFYDNGLLGFAPTISVRYLF